VSHCRAMTRRHPIKRTLFAGLLLLSCLSAMGGWQPSSAVCLHETGVAATAEELLEDLFRSDPDVLRDYHGNANNRLQCLMVLRFSATDAITTAIDQLESDPKHEALTQALYRVLGFVKDPASIPWLRTKLASPRRAQVLDHWLYEWQSFVGIGFGNNEGFGNWPWLTGREHWIALMKEIHAESEDAVSRLIVLNVLKGFDDHDVRAYFREVSAADRSSDEWLLAHAYLVQHGDRPDTRRIEWAISALAGDPVHRDLLLGTADALRHEAFVPYLIDTWDVARPNVMPASYDSRIMLEKVTYAVGPDSAQAWRTWFEAHGNRTRDDWVNEALASFRALRERDAAAARIAFDQLTYRWNDAAALPLIRELLDDPAYHSRLAGWLNMTYTPHLREQLTPIANVLTARPHQLEDWARDLLRTRGFLPSPTPETWEDHVRGSNLRI
jgi:hypothetical protein